MLILPQKKVSKSTSLRLKLGAFWRLFIFGLVRLTTSTHCLDKLHLRSKQETKGLFCPLKNERYMR